MARPLRAGARRSARATAAALAAALLAACGVSADEGPRDIPQAQVPTTTSTTTPPVPDEGTAEVDLWFTQFSDRDERDMLWSVGAEVPVDESGRPTPGVMLEALFQGVPADAAADGVRTRIPSETALATSPPEQDGTELTIDLDTGIEGLPGEGSRLAFGQMVCTVTELDGVDSVRFTRQGADIAPLDGSGEARTGPLTCGDYRERISGSADGQGGG